MKEQLYKFCLDYAEQRIAHAQTALNEATEAANDETKSSAGDKHETGRAMAQLEQEKAVKQLAEARELKIVLEKLDVQPAKGKIKAGNLVYTDKGNYFIAISAGKIMIAGKFYFAVSAASPIGTQLMGREQGNTFTFNGQSTEIKKIE